MSVTTLGAVHKVRLHHARGRSGICQNVTTMVKYIKNDKNYINGFRIRVGVRRRHRGPPFALGYHQFIIIVAIQDEGERECAKCNHLIQKRNFTLIYVWDLG